MYHHLWKELQTDFDFGSAEYHPVYLNYSLIVDDFYLPTFVNDPYSLPGRSKKNGIKYNRFFHTGVSTPIVTAGNEPYQSSIRICFGL